ncbi:MAG: hypothetical protein L6R38_008667 [Xanthoria sp. 2 TBL-2021]|nr:MAG: hypothetical protein L6R38_008667 [Xanthoria sp. 2 TBL-2021]
MKSRRTASTDFSPQPSSDYASSSSRRKPHDDLVGTSKSRHAASIVESSYTITTTTSSAPARLQSARDNARHSQSPTTPTRRVPPTSPLRRQHQTHHHRRSTPEAHHALAIPHRPRTSEGADRDCLETASLEPPITKESLSELDLNKIVNDNRLRHDINFEHEIIFRPNTHARQGAQKKREDDAYFEALAIEFDHYIKHQKAPLPPSSQPDHKRSAALPSTPSSHKFPRRVPPMIIAIREVIQTLVPTAKWQTVDDHFDPDLRMQELEHGICNIAGLFDWTGQLLLCSCSPMRDDMVTAMVAKSQQAVASQNAHQLVDSIRDLFGVLETMKLDVANHQIRYLRLYLLEESVQFEQNQILDRIAAGWSIFHERCWFERTYSRPESQDRFLMFKEKVVEKIVTPMATFPLTLAPDHERLKHLQHDFRLCHYHLACGHAFRHALNMLGFTGALPTLPYTECMKHIGAIIGAQGSDFDFGAHPDVVLEIVRKAFKVCNIKILPDKGTLDSAGWYLGAALNRQTALYSEIEGTLWDELSTLVHLEVEAIFDMNPLQILNRYDPGPPGSPMKNRRGGDLSLQSISKRAAHIMVLHWRVWAPILYNQPDPESSPTMRNQRPTTEPEEMAERRQTRVSLSSVTSSQPVLVQGRHRTHTASLGRGSTRSETPIYTPTSSDTESMASETPGRSNAPSA